MIAGKVRILLGYFTQLQKEGFFQHSQDLIKSMIVRRTFRTTNIKNFSWNEISD